MVFRSLGLLHLLALLSIPTAAQQQQATLPGKVDLEPEYRRLGLAPRDQGERNTCSLFAITAAAELEYHRNNQNAPLILSEEFLVWAANEATGLTGDQAMFTEAVHGLNALGICQASLAQYQQSDATSPSERAVDDARQLIERWKVNWIKRWSLDRVLSEREFLEIKTALANGHPVAVGLRWPKQPPTEALLEVSPPGEVFDGHSIAFTGYEDDVTKPGGGVFLFRNSFGSAWGRNGYGVISYAYARTYANDALWLECGSPGSEKPTARFEAETLAVAVQETCPVAFQSMDAWGGRMWSRRRQLFCRAEKGGRVEVVFQVNSAGRYRVRLLATAAPDFGTIRASIDGKSALADFDLYAGRVFPSGPLQLGEYELSVGKHTLGITVVGKNASSTDYFFGLDALDLYRQ